MIFKLVTAKDRGMGINKIIENLVILHRIYVAVPYSAQIRLKHVQQKKIFQGYLSIFHRLQQRKILNCNTNQFYQ